MLPSRLPHRLQTPARNDQRGAVLSRGLHTIPGRQKCCIGRRLPGYRHDSSTCCLVHASSSVSGLLSYLNVRWADDRHAVPIFANVGIGANCFAPTPLVTQQGAGQRDDEHE